jgi:hypothetical protein
MSLNEMIPSTNLVLCSITTTRRTPGNKRHNFKSAYAKNLLKQK